MPLVKSSSPKAFKSNLKAEVRANPGKSNMKKNLAIAYSTQRQAKAHKMSKGGSLEGCVQCEAGSCMEHGGPDEVTRDTFSSGGMADNIGVSGQGAREASKMPSSDTMMKRKSKSFLTDKDNDDLPGLEREAHFAEGGAVDDQRPLKTNPSNDNLELDEQDPPERAQAEDIDARLQSSEQYSDDEQDLPTIVKSLSLAAEIMKDRKRRKFAEGGKVNMQKEMKEPDSDEHAMSVGSSGGPIDPPDMSDLSNNDDELDNEPLSGREETRGMNISVPHVMTDPEHDESNSTDDSDYADNDDSLIGQILRDRKNRRR
jgi:hypothetical protein